MAVESNFEARNTVLVYCLKPTKNSLPVQDKPLWHTFGYYEYLHAEIRKDNSEYAFSYKDSFAIRRPDIFRSVGSQAKQVFSLIPIPNENEKDRGDGYTLFEVDQHLGAPFLGLILVTVNLLQFCGKTLKDDSLLAFLREECGVIEEKLKKGGLSERFCHYMYCSTNCADLCVVIRTDQLEDIYYTAKLLRIHFSTNKSGTLCHPPQISTITAMSRFLDSYCKRKDKDEDENEDENENKKVVREDIWSKNKHVVVDFRLTCHKPEEEDELLNKQRRYDVQVCDSQGNCERFPGERCGGVLGIGQYSIHLPLIEYLSLFFNKTGIFDVPVKQYWASLNGSHSEFTSGESTDVPEQFFAYLKEKYKPFNTDVSAFSINNARLRFCSRHEIPDRSSENTQPPVEENEGHSNMSADIELSSAATASAIEKELMDLCYALSVYRNKVYSSSYCYKEAYALINDLCYTFNDLLYTEDIHSYVFAMQLFSMLAGIKEQLSKLCDKPEDVGETGTTAEVIGRENGAERESIADKIVEIIQIITECVRSINAYNRPIAAFDTLSMNYPNYEIQAKVNIEKYQVAYSAFLEAICRAACRQQETQCIYPYVYLDISADRITTRQFLGDYHMWDHGDPGQRFPRLLGVACPNYRRFANIYHLLPQLCHEVSHYIRTLDREERNAFLLQYMLERMSMNVATKMVSQTVSFARDSCSTEMLSAIAQAVQTVILDGFKKVNKGWKEFHYDVLHKTLLLYLRQYSGIPEGEADSNDFYDIWDAYRELLSQVGYISQQKVQVYTLNDLEQLFLDYSDAGAPSLTSCAQDVSNKLALVASLNVSALEAILVRHGYVRNELHDQTAEPARWEKFLQDLTKADEKEKQFLSIGWESTDRAVEFWYRETAQTWLREFCKQTENNDTIYIDLRSLKQTFMSIFSSVIFFSGQYYSYNDFRKIGWEKTRIGRIMEQYKGEYILLLHSAYNYDYADMDMDDYIQSAQKRITHMLHYAEEMMDFAEDDPEQVGRIENVSLVVQSIFDSLNTLRGLLRDMEVNPQQRSLSLVNYQRLGERLSEEIKRNLKTTENVTAYLQAYITRKLTNADFCRDAFHRALDALNLEQIWVMIKKAWHQYGEVCADLGMCAAMQLSPFGYLACSSRLFTETLEHEKEDVFTQNRFLETVLVLLMGGTETVLPDGLKKEVQPAEHLRKLLEEINQYEKRIFDLCEEWFNQWQQDWHTGIQKLQCFKEEVMCGPVLNAQKCIQKFRRRFVEDYKRQDLDLNVNENWQKILEDLVYRFRDRAQESFAEEMQTCLNRISSNLRELLIAEAKEGNSSERKSNSSERKKYREINEALEVATALLTELRTFIRIKGLSIYLIPQFNMRIYHRTEKDLTLTHYRSVYRGLCLRADGEPQDWIKCCRTEPTIQHISRHYSDLYCERELKPFDKEKNDQEFVDSIDFVLRYYYKGCQAHRKLLSVSNTERADTSRWFRAFWGEEMFPNPASRNII